MSTDETAQADVGPSVQMVAKNPDPRGLFYSALMRHFDAALQTLTDEATHAHTNSAEDTPACSAAEGGGSSEPAAEASGNGAASPAAEGGDVPDKAQEMSDGTRQFVKAVRALMEGCNSLKDYRDVVPLVAAALPRMCGMAALSDPNVALFSACLVSTLCVHGRGLAGVQAGPLFQLVLEVATKHVRQKKILHVSFTAFANLAHMPTLRPAAVDPAALTQLVAPLYMEAPIVEAWSMAVNNLAVRFHECAAAFNEAGADVVLERLLLYFGDDPRVVSKGLPCLAALGATTVCLDEREALL